MSNLVKQISQFNEFNVNLGIYSLFFGLFDIFISLLNSGYITFFDN